MTELCQKVLLLSESPVWSDRPLSESCGVFSPALWIYFDMLHYIHTASSSCQPLLTAVLYLMWLEFLFRDYFWLVARYIVRACA